MYTIIMAHVTLLFCRFIEILNKHKPKIVWNPTVKEHEFYYQ